MARFDYSYYKEIYGGELSEREFDRFSPAAADVVSVLTGTDVAESEDDGVLRALCIETDDCARFSGVNPWTESESAGDYSATYDTRHVKNVCGIPVSAEAAAALTRCGLLTRWS